MRVEQLMTRNVKVCNSADTLNRATQLMWEYDIGCVPVLSADGDGKIVGIITEIAMLRSRLTPREPRCRLSR
jgi:CBS domain-containing protein